MSSPLDDGRDPTRERKDYRLGLKFGRDEFRDKYSQLDYWRSRPLFELQNEIRKLENENHSESTERARVLRQVMANLHDESRTGPSRRSRLAREAPTSPVRGSLPPSAIMGRVTGGNYPRESNVQDFHRGFSQRSSKTRQMLSDRHDLAQRQMRNTSIDGEDREMDRRLGDLERHRTGLQRQPYSHGMDKKPIDADRLRQEVPRTLAKNFQDSRRRADRHRERDSKYTKAASLEVWKQRQLDKKYNPKQLQSLPRQYEFGPQQSQQYSEDWKYQARTQMPFAPLPTHFGETSTRSTTPKPFTVPKSKWKKMTSKLRGSSKPNMPTISETSHPSGQLSEVRERSWSRSAPDLSGGNETFAPLQALVPSERPASLLSLDHQSIEIDPERPPLGQRVANRYVTEARNNRNPSSRQERIAIRRQRNPFVQQNDQGIDMQETQEEMEIQRIDEERDRWRAFRRKQSERWGFRRPRTQFTDRNPYF